ncbi:hypothetical protein TIFTF001_013693 [Ficus carica]|uniref:Uncharacterized protein n=1 Tax=Ficus carica TaxID=3494 RepID=A0AA88D6A3_FICCA|nr:hypothetical protein TIFTF001_013693 [Ficus carica]
MRSLDVAGFAQSLYVWLPIKEKHFEVMETPVGYLSRAFQCLRVPRKLGCSGDPVGLNSECPWQGTRRQASIDTGGGHHVSLTRRHRLMPGARAGARTRPVAARTVRGHEHGQSTVVVREVLPDAVSRAPKVITLWSVKGRSSTLEVVVVQSGSRGRIFNKFDLVWSVVHGHRPFHSDLENESTRSRAIRSL